VAHLLKVIAFQDVEGLHHHRALSPEAGFAHFISAIGAANRLVLFSGKAGEVFARDEAAIRLRKFGDAAREVTLVEVVTNRLDLAIAIAAGFLFHGNQLAQGLGKSGLFENLAAARNLAAGHEEGARRRPQVENLLIASDERDELLTNRELVGVL